MLSAAARRMFANAGGNMPTTTSKSLTATNYPLFRPASVDTSPPSPASGDQKPWPPSGGGAVHPVYFKVKEIQKAYQVDNGLLIHERHGPFWNVVRYVTYLLTVAGLADFGYTGYKMMGFE